MRKIIVDSKGKQALPQNAKVEDFGVTGVQFGKRVVTHENSPLTGYYYYLNHLAVVQK